MDASKSSKVKGPKPLKDHDCGVQALGWRKELERVSWFSVVQQITTHIAA